ncbi:bifunctional 2-polyprenyl-6-hydroxyphenol methylase/3-demethylubiquinol 3-O-methyltransferase UbiG [Acidocella sp. MX-AZ03]|uniref:bifunctional 2-polyprenyl-6-hydroxyphenol methylase/3-demethylubiquinol 3-O-methyltransferase UbiG n=1 Tax=Acidocella sp. MX-AZ03 TaxID=2697363 RepID=UPI002FD80DBB
MPGGGDRRGAGHAQGQGLNITYRHGTAEGLAAEGASFPVVTALEIIEHVADPLEFLKSLRALLAPGGVLFLSTLNRTPQSYAVAKFGAEYVLRLLPVGTHDWKMFIKPEELGRLCRQAGLRLTDTAGLSYSPRQAGFTVSRDLSVNYIAMAVAA